MSYIYRRLFGGKETKSSDNQKPKIKKTIEPDIKLSEKEWFELTKASTTYSRFTETDQPGQFNTVLSL